MILKKYKDFINEDYNHSKNDWIYLNRIEYFLYKDLKKYDKDLRINFLSVKGAENYLDSKIINKYNTFLNLYFTDYKINDIREILDKYIIDYEFFIREYDKTSNVDVIIMFDIEKEIESNLAKSLIKINKFNL